LTLLLLILLSSPAFADGLFGYQTSSSGGGNATNITGGAAGQVDFQSAASVTSFLPQMSAANSTIMGPGPSTGTIAVSTNIIQTNVAAGMTLDVAQNATINALTAVSVTAPGGAALQLSTAPSFAVGVGNAGLGCAYIGYSDWKGNASSVFAVSGTTTTTSATEFYVTTLTINANTLTANGSYIILEAGGTLAINTNAKFVAFESNNSVSLTTLGSLSTTAAAPTVGNAGWKEILTITRTGASTQAWSEVPTYAMAGSPKAAGGTSSLTETAAIPIAVTMEGSATTGDVSFLYAKAWACGSPT
jgi:hypothetical protein